MPTVIRVLAGLGLLTLGRKLFWLFVALVGFEFGFFIAERFFQRSANDLLALGIGVLFGIVAALIAIFLQQLAIYVGGFLAGGTILVQLLEMFGLGGPRLENVLLVVVFVVGGIIGAVVMMYLFDWALIVLSSLAGAGLLSGVATSNGVGFGLIIFVVLFIIGVVVQAQMMSRSR